MFQIWPLTLFKQSSEAAIEALDSSVLSLVKLLADTLPEAVLTRQNCTFWELVKGNWAQQECESVPACIVRPSTVEDLSVLMVLLRKERALFAIRSGGHSPTGGAASIQDGILIDMSLFQEITPRADSTVVVGTAARWGQVYQVLEQLDLAVAGGRDSSVGVGGFLLGGGLSFFAPRYGLASNNVVNYEMVLADGSIVNASEKSHPDLWHALKGASNDFGIVTRFTLRTFPHHQIWAGYLYMPAFQAPSVIKAFYDHVNRPDPDSAGPIVTFAYASTFRLHLVACNLVNTKRASFTSLLRFWSTCRTRNLKSVTDELSTLSPHGNRQLFANTVVANDLSTLRAAHSFFQNISACERFDLLLYFPAILVRMDIGPCF